MRFVLLALLVVAQADAPRDPTKPTSAAIVRIVLPPKPLSPAWAWHRGLRGLPFSVHWESEPAAVVTIFAANSRGLRPLRAR